MFSYFSYIINMMLFTYYACVCMIVIITIEYYR